MINTEDVIHMLSYGLITGECNKVILGYETRNLVCQFVSDDQTMTGTAIFEKFNDGNSFFGNEPIAIADVAGLIKMLKTIGKEFESEVVTIGRGDQYLLIRNNPLEMRVPLIRRSQIPRIPRIMVENIHASKTQEAFIDGEFIKKFYKMSGAMKDCKYVYIDQEDDMMQVIISQTEDYKNGIKFDLKAEVTAGQFHITKFDMKKFRTLLYNSKDCVQGKLLITSNLLATMQFLHKKSAVKLHLVTE